MKNKVFGLDIGTNSMKAVWLNNDRAHLSFNACITMLTPLKGMMSESAIDQRQIAMAVRKMLSDGKISADYTNIALADNQVFTKVIDMPLLSDKELSSAIYWEAEQYIPAPLNTMSLSWEVLRRQTNLPTPTMQVLLVAAPNALIHRYQKILELAGINIASIETETLAVVRTVVNNENFPTSLIVHMGSLSTSLAIVQSGNIVFTYSIPLGGIAMNRAIASDFAFSLAQAEEYKKIYGILKDNLGGKIGKAIEPILTSIQQEVKKALSYYTEKYQNQSPIGQIVLSGGSAKLPGIDLFFAERFGIETVIFNPWKMLKIDHIPKEIMDNGAEYTVAVGLALKNNE